MKLSVTKSQFLKTIKKPLVLYGIGIAFGLMSSQIDNDIISISFLVVALIFVIVALSKHIAR